MPDKLFLDTNIAVYCFDCSAPAKQAKAKALMAGKNWVCSWQVVQEFSNVALHKFEVPMKPADLLDYLRLVLWPRCRILPSEELYTAALGIHSTLRYRMFDSLIIAAALASGASELFSEDLQHGQKIGSLTLRNPFR